MESITLEDARRVIAGAEVKAQAIGQPMNIAVVGDGGNLRAHVRIGRRLHRQHRHLDQQGVHGDRVPDADQGSRRRGTQSGQPLFGLSDPAGGRIVIFAGGIPLVRDGRVVGAVDVSTGTVEQDQEVAEAGAGAF
jgi:uncharacterized protein GlcG (DUF336 family)